MIRSAMGLARRTLLSLYFVCMLSCGSASLLDGTSEEVDVELRLGSSAPGPSNRYDQGISRHIEHSAVGTASDENDLFRLPSNQNVAAKSLGGELPGAMTSSAQGSRIWQHRLSSHEALNDADKHIGSLLSLGGHPYHEPKRTPSPVSENVPSHTTTHITNSRLQGYPGECHEAEARPDQQSGAQLQPGSDPRAQSSNALESLSLIEAKKSVQSLIDKVVDIQRYASGKDYRHESVNAGQSQPKDDLIGAVGIRIQGNPTGNSEELGPRPEDPPEACKIINLETLSVIQFPKILPHYSDKKKLVTLAAAWAYNQKLDQSKEEISILKSKFKDLVYISDRIQDMIHRMQSCFGIAMPRHDWFLSYGNRIFPEIVAMHLNHIAENDILDAQAHLIKKWASVLDQVRYLERHIPTKLLIRSDALIRLLDTLIKTRLEEARLGDLLQYMFSFSKVQNSLQSEMYQVEALERIWWLTRGLMLSPGLVNTEEMKSDPEIGIFTNILGWDIGALTQALKSEEDFQSKMKGRTRHLARRPKGPNSWLQYEKHLQEKCENMLLDFMGSFSSTTKHLPSARELWKGYYAKGVKNREMLVTLKTFGSPAIQPLPIPTEAEAKNLFEELLSSAPSRPKTIKKHKSSHNEQYESYVSAAMRNIVRLMLEDSKLEETYPRQLTRVLKIMRSISNIQDEEMQKWALQEISPLIIFGNKPALIKSETYNASLLRTATEFIYSDEENVPLFKKLQPKLSKRPEKMEAVIDLGSETSTASG